MSLRVGDDPWEWFPYGNCYSREEYHFIIRAFLSRRYRYQSDTASVTPAALYSTLLVND